VFAVGGVTLDNIPLDGDRLNLVRLNLIQEVGEDNFRGALLRAAEKIKQQQEHQRHHQP